MIKRLNKNILLLFLLIPCGAFGQSEMEGLITFVTSKNAYVKFPDTQLVEPGDTLKLEVDFDFVPCLLVTDKSSRSCVCLILNDCNPVKGDKVFFSTERKLKVKTDNKGDSKEDIVSDTSSNEISRPSTHVKGRLSAAGYSSMSSQRSDRHRMMYRLSMDADHIYASKFSFETYLNYRNLIYTEGNPSNTRTSIFNIYNAAVSYQADSTFTLTLGRKVNPNASSLGAIDGLQIHKEWEGIYAGIIVGSRPDFGDFSFNPNLVEYGGFAGTKFDREDLRGKFNLGLLQQTNSGKIDRRYIYLQENANIFSKLNVFASAELDLYASAESGLSNSTRLTNLYVSARYRMNKKLSFMVSYNSRRRIVFFETFRTELERMLEDDESRQGLRARVNYKPFKYSNLGVSFSNRFQNSQQNKSQNININFSQNHLPFVGGRLTLTYNRNLSNYLESNAYSVRQSNYLFDNKLNLDLYFRRLEHTYIKRESIPGIDATSIQNFYGLGLTYMFTRSFSFGSLIEYSELSSDDRLRINLRLIKRFDNYK